MRVEKRDGSVVRKILIGMIVDQTVLGHIASIWEPELFSSKWANLIARWAVSYYNKYDKPPRRSIEGMFESWAAKADDEDTVKLVERFVHVLSEEYSTAKELNAEHVIDLARVYFNKCKLIKLADGIQGDIDLGHIEEAKRRVESFGSVEIGAGFGVDVLLDKEAVRKAFLAKAEPLIRYPSALKNFFGSTLCRGGFIAFMGPEKRGKTFWLMDMAWRAMLQRKRVAFFEVGDMTQDDIEQRWMARAAKRPLEKCKFDWPTSIDHNPGETSATIETDRFEYDRPMRWGEGWSAYERVQKHKIRSKESYLKLVCTPNDTMTVDGIASVLQSWERKGWVPDVCVIDYADILAPRTGIREEREQINSIWKGLRRISQSGSQPLVVTATQADAASYDAHTMSSKHFSNDKRKYAHVTGMIGINQTPEEKEQSLQRLNWIMNRGSRFNQMKCVHVAGCLEVGNPAILSTF